MGPICELELYGCRDSIGSSRKHGDERIASNLACRPPVSTYDFGESAEGVSNASVSKCLIQAHERGRAHHVGVQQHSELARRFFHSLPRFELGPSASYRSSAD
jgi:hypothetical protein